MGPKTKKPSEMDGFALGVPLVQVLNRHLHKKLLTCNQGQRKYECAHQHHSFLRKQ